MTTRTHESMYTPEQLAEKAYVAFCATQGNVDVNNQRFVPWQNLPTAQKSAWIAVVHQVTIHTNAVGGRGSLTERELELQGKSPTAAADRKEEAAERKEAAAEERREEAREEAKDAADEKKAKAHGHSAR